MEKGSSKRKRGELSKHRCNKIFSKQIIFEDSAQAEDIWGDSARVSYCYFIAKNYVAQKYPENTIKSQ